MRGRMNGLMGNFRIDDETGCWNWTKGKDNGGYARGTYLGKSMTMSRVVAILYLGLDPKDAETFALHRCDNRGCVNPKHIFLGSWRENYHDARNKGRLAFQLRGDFCFKGHALVGENVYQRPDNPLHRECRTCRNERMRQWHKANG